MYFHSTHISFICRVPGSVFIHMRRMFGDIIISCILRLAIDPSNMIVYILSLYISLMQTDKYNSTILDSNYVFIIPNLSCCPKMKITICFISCLLCSSGNDFLRNEHEGWLCSPMKTHHIRLPWFCSWKARSSDMYCIVALPAFGFYILPHFSFSSFTV